MPSLEYSLSGSTDVQTAVVDAPKTKATCGILLGHGAGGDSNSGHLPKIAQAFCDAGILCVRFNCKPPNLAKRVAHAEACLLSAQEKFSVDHWITSGSSMGGRVASSVAHAHPDIVIGAIFFSYPLHPPGKQEQLRDSPLVDLQQPVLFLHGTRDNFCEEEQFQAILKRMTSSDVQVHSMEGGDHGLKAKGGKAVAEAAITEAVDAAISFAKGCAEKGEKGASGVPDSPEPQAPKPAGRQAKQTGKRKAATEPDGKQSAADKTKKRKSARTKKV